MISTYNKSFLKSNIIYLIILFFFSFFINFYYANIGTFPIDTFFHYDGAYRILKNEYPVKDFWIVSGFIIDLIQSFFFKILGVNWTAYIFHSSILNFFISFFVFYFFYSIGIENKFCLFFSCCFSVLAYTISGTPFVDHHAIFFLLVGTFFLIQGFYFEKGVIWFFAVLFYFLSFLTKQVPAAYLIIVHGFIISIYLIKFKKLNIIRYIFFSALILIVLFIFLLIYLKIDFKSFYIQYFDYPRSIGAGRISNFKFSIESFFNKYKFIIFPIVAVIIILINKIKNNFNIFPKKNYYVYLILFSFVLCSIFHQIMTKNQIYIYFLIPIIFGILYSELKKLNFKYKKKIFYILFISLILITTKYHFRFNENRKFHELEKTNLSSAVPAKRISQSLGSLLWINPLFNGKPDEEINLIMKGITQLEEEKNEIMLISHYLFLDSITKKNLNYPNRSFTIDGASMPLKGNKYYDYYKNFLINILNKKKIQKVYYFKQELIPQNTLTDYLSEACLEKSQNKIFIIYKIQCSN